MWIDYISRNRKYLTCVHIRYKSIYELTPKVIASHNTKWNLANICLWFWRLLISKTSTTIEGQVLDLVDLRSDQVKSLWTCNHEFNSTNKVFIHISISYWFLDSGLGPIGGSNTFQISKRLLLTRQCSPARWARPRWPSSRRRRGQSRTSPPWRSAPTPVRSPPQSCPELSTSPR